MRHCVCPSTARRGRTGDAGSTVRGGHGYRLGITWNTAPVLVKRLQGGETADVLILNRAGMDAMTRDRRVRAGSEVTLASSATALAVKAGAPRPDISTPEALKRTLLAARAISYSDQAAGGASGIYLAKLLERLGIASEVNAKTTYPPPAGLCGDLLASADADLPCSRNPSCCRFAASRSWAATRRPAHGHGVRRLRGSVERRGRDGPGADRLPAIAGLSSGLPRQGARSGLTGPRQKIEPRRRKGTRLATSPKISSWLWIPRICGPAPFERKCDALASPDRQAWRAHVRCSHFVGTR